MEYFDLIGQLKRYATANNWHFLAGQNWEQDYRAHRAEFDNGQLVLGCFATGSPKFSNGYKLVGCLYESTVMLGRKFDDKGTISKLDETFQQKYDNRLLELNTLLATHLALFSCANELIIGNVNFVFDMNKFTTNIDFVVANVNFEQ